MRKIRGWIRNLADGLGPPPGSVQVHARPAVDNAELDLEDHELGALSLAHLVGGSSSITDADASGHFGWDMELSPGPITTQIIPTDPQTEYRYRFPDESAQIGKAFHSDLERLGWAAGRDCLVWGAIEGAVQPTSSTWGTDPGANAGLGDWSIASYGTGADAGRVTLRPGIAFLGGVVFSIEAGPLQVPVVGESAAAANGSGSDRWDLLYLAMDVDPLSTTYGKQSINIQQGTPGGGIPSLAAVAGSRRLVVHALKMVAGATVYSAAVDLRPWNPASPPALSSGPTAKTYEASSVQGISTVVTPSLLNTAMASNEILLSPGSRYCGTIHWMGMVTTGPSATRFYISAHTEGWDAAGVLVAGTDFVQKPAVNIMANFPMNGSDAWRVQHSWPISVIPAFTPTPPSASVRNWTRLRPVIRMAVLVGDGAVAHDQYAWVSLWPVP